MSKVIDSLTPEQEAMIPVYVDRFLKIGLSTEPTDKTAAEAAVNKLYAYFNKLDGSCQLNPQFVWTDSPMQAARIAAQYTKGSEDVTQAEIQEQASSATYGSFEAYWVSTWAFIDEQLPVTKDELASIANEIVQHCGVYWTFENLVVMSPKPTVIHMVNSKLHNAKGPAISYPNGHAIYAFKGEVKGSLMEVSIADRVDQVGTIETDAKT
jgi:hypothetical protein